jgi:hypothetical protein
MHTGSHTLWYGILKDWVARDIGPNRTYEDGEVVIGHLTDKNMVNWRAWFGEQPLLIPLRHPAKALSSHFKRNEQNPFWMTWFAQQWCNLIEIESHYPYYIHIDIPELRDQELAKINDELGLNLSHDWAINEAMGCKHGGESEPLQHHLVSMVPDSFIRFYEETLNG